MDAGGFWEAARTFRAPPDSEARHRARVTLLRMALGDTGPVGERAAEALRKEGIIVVRDIYAVGARAL